MNFRLSRAEQNYMDESFKKKVIFATGLIVTLIILFAVLSGERIFTRLDYRMYDFLSNAVPDGPPSKLIVIADIDNKSLEEVGQWPWSRYKTAEMIRNISESGAAAIGLDAIFPEEDRTSLVNIKESLNKDYGLNVEVINVPRGFGDNDEYMSLVLADGPFVLSNYFTFDGTEQRPKVRIDPLRVKGLTGDEDFYNADGVLTNLNKFQAAAGHSGFFNSLPDMDGLTRKVPLVIRYGDDVYPLMSLRTFMTASGLEEAEMVRGFGGQILKVGDKSIPVSRNGTAWLNFKRGADLYKTYSAADILYGRVPGEAFFGKIVFVGASATGINDLHSTSLRSLFPGVEIHAAFVDNLINGDFFHIPSWTYIANLISVLSFGIGITLLSLRIRPSGFLYIMPVIIFGAVILSYAVLFAARIYISPTPAVIVAVNVFFFLTGVSIYIEEKRNRMQAKMLSGAQAMTIRSMASVAETRDPETGEHILRTQLYVKIIAERLLEEGHFTDELCPETINLLYLSAPLHDVGKVGISDSILLKPAKLTEEEFEIMKTHAELGVEIMKRAEEAEGSSSFLTIGMKIAGNHHEKWDGSGYPKGLKGDEISLYGRIMAVADVYDALRSRRSYKEPFSHEKSMKILLEGRGSHFDPKVIDAFLAIEEDVIHIADSHRDK